MTTSLSKNIKALIIAASVLACTGCVRDNLDHRRKSCELKIRITDNGGNDITGSATIDNVFLYLFCGKGNFVERIPVSAEDIRAGRPVRVEYDGLDRITAIVWGNINGPNIEMDGIGAGTNLSQQLYLRLKDHSLSGNRSEGDTENRSPRELHYGRKTIDARKGVGSFDEEITVKSTVAKVNVVTKHLRRWTGCDDWTRFSFVVYGTRDRLSFAESKAEGNPAVYRPSLELDPDISTAKATLTTFPCYHEPLVELRIYHDGQMVYGVNRYDDGTPFKVYAGEELDIYVTFDAGGTIHVTVEPWDDGGQHTEF